MELESIISLATTAVVALVVVGYCVVKCIKNKWLSKLIDCVKVACREAEIKYGAGHGSEKKNYVMDAVKAKCEELGIPYLRLYKAVANLIEQIVDGYNTITKGK